MPEVIPATGPRPLHPVLGAHRRGSAGRTSSRAAVRPAAGLRLDDPDLPATSPRLRRVRPLVGGGRAQRGRDPFHRIDICRAPQRSDRVTAWCSPSRPAEPALRNAAADAVLPAPGLGWRWWTAPPHDVRLQGHASYLPVVDGAPVPASRTPKPRPRPPRCRTDHPLRRAGGPGAGRHPAPAAGHAVVGPATRAVTQHRPGRGSSAACRVVQPRPSQHAVDQGQVEPADELGVVAGQPVERAVGQDDLLADDPRLVAGAGQHLRGALLLRARRRLGPLRPQPRRRPCASAAARTASWTGTPSRTDRSTASASTSPDQVVAAVRDGHRQLPVRAPVQLGRPPGTRAGPSASAAGTPRRAGPPPPAGPGGTSPSAAASPALLGGLLAADRRPAGRRRTGTAPAAPARPGQPMPATCRSRSSSTAQPRCRIQLIDQAPSGLLTSTVPAFRPEADMTPTVAHSSSPGGPGAGAGSR